MSMKETIKVKTSDLFGIKRPGSKQRNPDFGRAGEPTRDGVLVYAATALGEDPAAILEAEAENYPAGSRERTDCLTRARQARESAARDRADALAALDGPRQTTPDPEPAPISNLTAEDRFRDGSATPVVPSS